MMEVKKMRSNQKAATPSKSNIGGEMNWGEVKI
jgi:hypothetical protein